MIKMHKNAQNIRNRESVNRFLENVYGGRLPVGWVE